MKNRIIYKIRAGSHLYGLNTPESDEDYIGIYLSTPEEMYGLQKSEIIEENKISKQDNGKNDKDAVDCKYYELRKFCQLALNANPTILELLFANPENILICDNYGQQLLDNNHLFISKKVKHSYLGYAFSQKQKSQVKTSNLKKLIEAKNILEKTGYYNSPEMLYDFKHNKGADFVDGLIPMVLKFNNEELECYIKPDNSCIRIADLFFTNQKIKDVYLKIRNRIDRATNRADGMLDKGFDTKFMSHTVRLLFEGEELLKTGNINFPLKDKDILLQIKNGEYPLSKTLDLIDKKELEFEQLYDISPLPHSADFNAVNNLIINIYKDYLKDDK